MDLGFETTGNAVLVFRDKKPVLVTDPWITGGAYFGSWGLSHEIPQQVTRAILDSEYVWISHGHPDHLSARSLDPLGGKRILLPDHVGGLIAAGLRERGFNVEILKDRKWYQLSRNLRVLCIADYDQDAILLADVGGTLVCDFNDASDHGWGPFVKKIIRGFHDSFLLCLTGYGDTDMINIWREDGSFIEPRAARKRPVGSTIARLNHAWGTRYFIPFSSMHIYERQDSAWARQYRTDLPDYAIGFESTVSQLLPAFISYDVERRCWEPLSPTARDVTPKPPEEFGDDWSQDLEADDKKRLSHYFKSAEFLADYLNFINIRSGGKDYVIELAKSRFKRGITFEAPRNSLMTAIENEVFDDMLIGNFMKTILHGNFRSVPLYPYVGEYLTKFADNGRAKSRGEVRRYLAEYRRRAPLSYLRYWLARSAMESVRFRLRTDSLPYKIAASAYHRALNPRLVLHDLGVVRRRPGTTVFEGTNHH
ncbi:MAG TPA: hypothetical protein VJ728_01115 [Candidatus Binataceae bacterium]|nr:hypothetical protein [Candidatus Binataceae bacterium]